MAARRAVARTLLLFYRPEKRSLPVKTVTRIGLGFCFSLFLGLAITTEGRAEEYYVYKDPHGNLVISNKVPPTGSTVLKRQELPEATGPQVQQPHEGGDTKLNGHSEGSAKSSKNK
jgi:hypothetical protein